MTNRAALVRVSIARAMALARDERQRADHPIPTPPRMMMADDTDRLEAIAIDLAPRDIDRLPDRGIRQDQGCGKLRE